MDPAAYLLTVWMLVHHDAAIYTQRVEIHEVTQAQCEDEKKIVLQKLDPKDHKEIILLDCSCVEGK